MSPRKHPRIPVRILVDLSYSDSTEEKKKGRVVDISLSGVSVESETDFEENREVLLEINTPIEVGARVMRILQIGSSLYRYGLKYTKLGFFGKLRLRNYVKRWLKTVNNRWLN